MDVVIPMPTVGLTLTQPQFSRPNHGMFLTEQTRLSLTQLNGQTMTSMVMVTIGIILTGMLVGQRLALVYSTKVPLSLMLAH